MRQFLFSLLLIISAFTSCIPHKKYLYFREGDGASSIKTFPIDTTLKYKIQPGDILNITVSSTVTSKQELLNQKFKENEGGPENSSKVNGYVVTSDGNIELPLVGKIRVEGYALEQINELIRTRLNEYLDYIFVKVSLMNFKITVLGEVGRPGTQLIDDDKITIFQALGLAGDIDDLGNRKKVRIIRKVGNENQVISLDISKTNIIGSPYYYLQPNDILYVEPLKAKAVRFNLTLVTIATSVITLVVVLTRIK